VIKEEEYEEKMEKAEIDKLKVRGCIEEDHDYEDGCPGCGGPIFPRHYDELYEYDYLHAECSVCNVGFTDTTQEYTQHFHYFGGVEIGDQYVIYPEPPEWTQWKCPFHPDAHVEITLEPKSLGLIERVGKDGEKEIVSAEEYELPSKEVAKDSDSIKKRQSDMEAEAEKWALEFEAERHAYDIKKEAAKNARTAKYRVSPNRENKEGDGLNSWL
jgi:hypothetical protein